MSDKTEAAIKGRITRLRNKAKTEPMTLAQKLEILAEVKALREKLTAQRLARL